MKLSAFFERAGTKEIIVNSDIDGILSGMILQKYYGCKIVGFSNSKESIWIAPHIHMIDEPVYIDIFVNKPTVYCIDQHIVAYDNSHINRLLSYGTKMNPNLDLSRRTYCGDIGPECDYYHKYPFGTVHYLIALMKQDGIEVEFNDIERPIKVVGNDNRSYDICPAQIVLRADDALYSSLGPYKYNTDVWWRLLQSFGSTMIDRLIVYKDKCDPHLNRYYKDHLANFFCRGLSCDGIDGAFDTITDGDNQIQGRIETYRRIISEVIGISVDFPTVLHEHRGYANRSCFSMEALNRAYTYAFVCGPSRAASSFSFTVDIL